MGQKVHPNGIRMGITKKTSSHWYAKNYEYAFFVEEDKKIREYICKDSQTYIITRVEIKRRAEGISIRIFSDKIGTLVGEERKKIEKLRTEVKSKCRSYRENYFRYNKNIFRKSTDTKLNINPEIKIFVRQLVRSKDESSYLAISIASDLEKRIPFRRAIRIHQEKVQNIGGALGVRIRISGRLNGSEIARKEWVHRGRVPLNTFEANLDYACGTASTIYGLIGIKVLIFHKEKLKL
jgi:small subunit ribosomal protein S3